jgi:Chromo (CHRromatin Organisation MOdifier) domain
LLRWRGPKRIVGTLSPHVFDVQDLATGQVRPAHASRLHFFRDSSLDITADLLEQIAHNNSGYEVRALRDLRYDAEAKTFSVLVSWLGFDPADDSWEPIDTLNEDVPDLVSSFLAKHANRTLVDQAKAILDCSM